MKEFVRPFFCPRQKATICNEQLRGAGAIPETTRQFGRRLRGMALAQETDWSHRRSRGKRAALS